MVLVFGNVFGGGSLAKRVAKALIPLDVFKVHLAKICKSESRMHLGRRTRIEHKNKINQAH